MTESFDNTDKTTGTQSGLTRRQVAIGAAWAAPVVALAVATPLAAASTTPVTTPSANVGGTLAAAFAGGTRTVNFTNGLVSYNPQSSGLETGNITVSLPLFGNVPDFPLTVDNTAWANLGWTRLANAGGFARFRHASISSGTVPTGVASWAGPQEDYVQVSVGLTVQTGGIGALGLTYTYDPDEV